MKKNKDYALKHVSIRVPWHDNKWDGSICRKPKDNGACLILKNCALNRDDDLETKNAGKSIDKLKQECFPCCVNERGTFMADFAFTKDVVHPYKLTSPDTHGHMLSTPLRFPAYSAAALPFLWLLSDSAQEKAEEYDLDFDMSREPSLSFSSGWIQECSNQKALLDCFFEHLEPENSLCFFYAKQVPFVESAGRVLIGVGKVKNTGSGVEYDYEAKGGLRSMLWEHMISHSIRPDQKDGFLLPYHDACKYTVKNPDFNPADLAVVVPDEKWIEFSYATEHVSNDTAIRLLRDCIRSLETASELKIGGDWSHSIKWIHDRISELEILRGPYPGLGASLCAFGIKKGHFIAQEIITRAGKKEDPWDLIDKMFNEPSKIISKKNIPEISDILCKIWQGYKVTGNLDRIELLQLLSRFDLSIEQAELLFIQEERENNEIDVSDKSILENPYLIFEKTMMTEIPVSFWTVDMGLYYNRLNKVKLLPFSVNIDDPFDERRIRAITIQQLEMEAAKGNTLQARIGLVNQIRDLPLKPSCKVHKDVYEIAEQSFNGGIERVEMADGSAAYQLYRLYNMGEIIRRTVKKRKSGKRHSINVDWRKMVDAKFDKDKKVKIDKTEEAARQEKVAALKELAESRFSVLLGPAGTGKTTLISILCQQKEIKNGGILFLAPTGKARVRMQQSAEGLDIPAYTLAQFLGQNGRYDFNTQVYKFSQDMEKVSIYETVIVDEASMLTEEMLSALFDCLKGVKRIILVGDHRQLPPIGTGRPFVDIINYLEPENIEHAFPKVSNCYVSLTIRRRQGGSGRMDLLFADWYSGNPVAPGEDSVFQSVINAENDPFIRFVQWKNESEFLEKFEQVLIEELNLDDINDVKNFNVSLGSTADGFYFNWKEAVDKVDAWQFLSPIHGKPFGVKAINRLIHKTFRTDNVEFARKRYKIPNPFGNEEIVYGDKVINIENHRRKEIFPKNGLQYIANGEIGIAVGQFKSKRHTFRGRPQNLEIEFSSQKGFKYSFKKWEFKEEGDSKLELAYAVTVHKSQGSEFELVLLIIPNPCFLLSRELFYTALTRQKKRVVVIHQGDLVQLKKYSSAINSETLQRITNLFKNPSPVEIKGKYLEKGLIQCASDGTLLRSKSELIIYERLLQKKIPAVYEKELVINEVLKLPDFTIEDDDTGMTYYWEHCGMLHDEEYKKRWEEKKEWYKENKILFLEDGGGENGTLIATADTEKGGISIPEIDKIIKKIQ